MILFTARLSRSQRTVLVAASVCLIAIFACVILVAAHNEDSELPARAVATSNADASVKTKTLERFGRLPLSFERNDGQTDQSVKFVSRGPGYDLFLTATDAVLSLQKPVAFTKDSPATVNAESDTNVREGTVLRLKLLGAAATP